MIYKYCEILQIVCNTLALVFLSLFFQPRFVPHTETP